MTIKEEVLGELKEKPYRRYKDMKILKEKPDWDRKAKSETTINCGSDIRLKPQKGDVDIAIKITHMSGRSGALLNRELDYMMFFGNWSKRKHKTIVRVITHEFLHQLLWVKIDNRGIPSTSSQLDNIEWYGRWLE